MKFLPFLVAVLAPLAVSFVVVPKTCRVACLARATEDDAQEHLKEVQEKWSKLEKMEKEIEKHPDEEAAYDLAKDMLETALDTVQTTEIIEKEHVDEAHHALEKAISDEKVLVEHIKEVHHDAEDADGILEEYKHEGILEDKEERREMAVSDIAHNVEDYVETRLRSAVEAELNAKEEESEATRNLEQLQRNEVELKATLEELKATRDEKEKQA